MTSAVETVGGGYERRLSRGLQVTPVAGARVAGEADRGAPPVWPPPRVTASPVGANGTHPYEAPSSHGASGQQPGSHGRDGVDDDDGARAAAVARLQPLLARPGGGGVGAGAAAGAHRRRHRPGRRLEAPRRDPEAIAQPGTPPRRDGVRARLRSRGGRGQALALRRVLLARGDVARVLAALRVPRTWRAASASRRVVLFGGCGGGRTVAHGLCPTDAGLTGRLGGDPSAAEGRVRAVRVRGG